MTIRYECIADLGEVNDFEYGVLTASLKKYGYEYEYESDQDGGKLIIEGEIEVDDYTYSAADVASEIDYILWNAADLDADIRAKEVEYEPDWDSMPGGYDAIWN